MFDFTFHTRGVRVTAIFHHKSILGKKTFLKINTVFIKQKNHSSYLFVMKLTSQLNLEENVHPNSKKLMHKIKIPV
jgi:hypothetical protein